MNAKLTELEQRRRELIARGAVQRELLAQNLTELRHPFKEDGLVGRLRAHPIVSVLAMGGALFGGWFIRKQMRTLATKGSGLTRKAFRAASRSVGRVLSSRR